MKTVLALLKIGSKEHQTALFEKGEIFMKQQNYFQGLEDNKVQGDKYEGSDFIEQVEWMKISNVNTGKLTIMNKGNGSKINHTSRDPSQLKNIYSMVGLSESDINNDQPIKQKNIELGKYFTLIYNVKEFNSRLLRKLRAIGYNPKWNWVKYYNEYDYEGTLDSFSKPKDYSYQKEVRYVVNPTSNAPIKVQIGSLADIAVLCKIESLKSIKLFHK
jgi:hypothetical protein